MQQVIGEVHNTDDNGNPSGGMTTSTGLSITWQNGPLCVNGERLEPNGCFVETVLVAARGRLAHYQNSKFASRYNADAIDHIDKALAALASRTKDREARGVEGTHTV